MPIPAPLSRVVTYDGHTNQLQRSGVEERGGQVESHTLEHYQRVGRLSMYGRRRHAYAQENPSHACTNVEDISLFTSDSLPNNTPKELKYTATVIGRLRIVYESNGTTQSQ